MLVSWTRSTCAGSRNKRRDQDGAFAGRERLGRLALRRRVERVTHHLQQLVVVVLHRALRVPPLERARSDLRVDVHDKSFY